MTKEKSNKTKADKSRILVLFLFLLVLVIGIVFALIGLKKHQEAKQYSGATLKGVPALESVAGSEKATQEYIRTQHQENLVKAQAAAERAEKEHESSASIPTVTRPVFQGESSDFIAGAKPGSSRAGCSPEEIKRARAAGVNASELRCKGCTVKDLRAFFTAAELKDAGFTASELKADGFTAAELKEAGFSAKEMFDSGFTANDLKNAAYTVADMKAAGVSLADLRKLGVDPAELRAAGFTAAEMRAAGFSVDDLKKAGFNAKELKNAGASVQELNDAGFSPMELMEAGATDQELAKMGILPDQIKALRAQLAAEKAKLPKDCSVGALARARANGVSATALADLKCDIAVLKAAGYTAEQLKKAGFSAKDLKAAGFTAAELKAGGYNAAELKALGLTAKELKEAGFSADELKAAAVSAEELKAAGYSASELKAAGFTPAELRQAGYDAAELLAAGVTAAELRQAGYTAEQMKAAGMSAADIKKAGFTDGELIRAGFTPEEISQSLLKSDPAELRQSGYSAAQLKAAGFGADKLRAVGYTAAELLAAGYSLDDLKKAGFSDEELLQAGVKPEELAAAKSKAQAGSGTTAQTNASGAKSVSPDLVTAASGENLSDPEKVLNQLRQRQAAQLSGEQKNELLQQIQVSMTNQTNELFSSWNPPPLQQFVEHEEKDSKDGAKKGSDGQKASEQGRSNAGENTNVIKAGSIMFAVLDTGVNSDEVSPILATIVQGPLKGAKLLGQFSRTEKKVVLNFTTMSLSQYPTSIGINAVAIDPDTARTAVASSVDSHYMLRYGSLFASSFLSGYATAVSESGGTTTNNPLGGTVVTTPPLDSKQKIAVALGNVGTQYSAEMSKNFSVPPTVIVDAGSGLGILFMADLALPAGVSS